ncbi:MAG: DUF1214 domain-containing protein [Myxococcota bacterium]
MRRLTILALWFASVGCSAAQPAPESTDEAYAPTPPSILTPAAMESPIGTLRFLDGRPDAATVSTAYEHLDFMRGVRAYLQAMPGAAMIAMRDGLYAAGLLPNYTVFVSESLMDARSRFLTLDTETVYATTWISLKGGPIVVETPPRTVGVLVDAWQRHLADTGYPGPDRGKGGTYVIVPPGYAGYVPDSQFAVRSRTLGVWMLLQGFLVDGRAEPATDNFKARLKIYPLKESDRPAPNQFVDMSSKRIDTVPPNDLGYFESIDALVQEEPRGSQDPEFLGLLSAIGIEKNTKFEPDARVSAILREAAAVGDITVRALLFGDRNPAERLREGSQWRVFAMAESDDFLTGHARELDARAAFRYFATAHVPKVADDILGRRTESAVTYRDAKGRPLDGSQTYAVTLPANVPAKNFWSIVAYDNQTRSMLQTDQRFASVNTTRSARLQRPAPRANEDGSTTLYFGPRPPPRGRGKSRKAWRANWIQTTPGRGWNAVLRLYGALEPWAAREWAPGDIERLDELPPVDPSARKRPKMVTPEPDGLIDYAKIESRIGTLDAPLGVPSDASTELVYANLDRIRAIDAFLTTLPSASLMAMKRGLASVGVGMDGEIGTFDRGIDAHSLVLTAPADTVDLLAWLDLRAGAVVLSNPPSTAGVVDDFLFLPQAEFGPSGADEGKGGLYLLMPPNYQGQISERYLAFASPTYGNWARWRAQASRTDSIEVSRSLEQSIEVYPFDVEFDFDEDFEFDALQTAVDGEDAAEPQEDQVETVNRFVGLSGRAFNTVHPNDASYYDWVHALLQEERAEAFSPEVLGLLAAIGIRQGQALSMSAARRNTLVHGAAIANATSRALAFRPRDPQAYVDETSGWYRSFVGNSTKFLRNGARSLDARAMFFYLSTDIGSALTRDALGAGSKSSFLATDSTGAYLDGAKSYTITLPPEVPATEGWSIVVYDPQTRSMLQTPGTSRPSLGSASPSLVRNLDGSTTLHFGPEPPAGHEGNWIQTVRAKGWFVVLRLGGPLKPWFSGQWRPGPAILNP